MSDSSFFSQSGSNEATATTINTKVNEAEAAKAAAEAAQAAAEAARDQANTSAADAQSSEDDAETAQAASEAARDTAVLNASAASASAVQSSTFRDDARKLAIELEDTQYQLSDGTIGYSALHYHEKASDSASAAAVSAGTASTDAGTASQNAATAITKAGEASASATAALQSEQNAAQSETNAGQSETNAAQSEANASQSETNASQSEANAGQSETNAAASASTATTQAGTATTKAGEASNSASSALSAQSAAEAARDSALSALDNFQDQYLGSYTSAPTATADGDPLASGMLYFNETDDAMKVYDGSQWLNAYASLSGALIANQNLSDLNNAATARTNLGLVAVASSGAYSDLTGTPTTIAGYGITDAFDGAFSSLTGKPTTVSGYGITDVPDDLLDLGITDGSNGQALKTDGAGNFSFGDVATSTAWADITGKPTTISGFGITDAFDGAYSSLTGTPDLTNYITNNVGGDFTVDSGTLFVDSSTNRVGINLGSGVSPTVPLNVAGTVRFQSTSSAGQMLEFTNYSSYSKLYRSNGSLQLQGGNTGNGILELSNSGGFTFDGNTIYHSGNLPTIPTNNNQLTNGAGYITSADGGNAATLDGIDSSQFLRSDAEDSGTILNLNGGTSHGANDATLHVTAADNSDWGIKVSAETGKTDYGLTLRMPSSFNNAFTVYKNQTQHVNIDSTGIIVGSGSDYVWHAGNDGAGSGLDADLLDGYHASTTRNAANTIPIRDANGYLQLGWINTTSGQASSGTALNKFYASYDDYMRYTPATNVLHRGNTLSYYRAYDWLEFRDTGAGVYWSNSTGGGWHIYPQSTSYMRMRSGNSGNGGIRCNTNGTDRNYIYWDSSNQVGFLTTGGGWAFRCDNSGNVTATGNVTAYSDIRLKTDIEPIEGALDRVSKLEGVEYTRKSTGEREIGFIAQNVIEHEPSLVDVVDASTAEQEALPDLHVMKYQNTTALLVEAVKELKAEVDTLRQEIAELKKES